jgi:hypothetical protein
VSLRLSTQHEPPGLTQRTLRAVGMCGDDVTYAAELQAFKNWANAHPEKRTEDMGAGVFEVLNTAWPCKVK